MTLYSRRKHYSIITGNKLSNILIVNESGSSITHPCNWSRLLYKHFALLTAGHIVRNALKYGDTVQTNLFRTKVTVHTTVLAQFQVAVGAIGVHNRHTIALATLSISLLCQPGRRCIHIVIDFSTSEQTNRLQ